MAGPVVTLTAKGDLLAVVWHGPAPPTPTDQSLRFAIYNANHRSLLGEGCLPLSSGSTLIWLAFTEELLLASFDSKVSLCIDMLALPYCIVHTIKAERSDTAVSRLKSTWLLLACHHQAHARDMRVEQFENACNAKVG